MWMWYITFALKEVEEQNHHFEWSTAESSDILDTLRA